MVQVESGIVVVKVEAPTYYGARHGLETLAQLIVYDEIENTMKVGGFCRTKNEFYRTKLHFVGLKKVILMD
jgi:hypothetical protein